MEPQGLEASDLGMMGSSVADILTNLRRSFSELISATTDVQRTAAANELTKAAASFSAESPSLANPDSSQVLEQDRAWLEDVGSRLAGMSDSDLRSFNVLLPWAAMTADSGGRIVGQAYSATKRASVHSLMDRRIAAFNDVFPLSGKSVLEIGCFEGIHTIGCLLLGAKVTGVDGRMENILKTLARLWAYQMQADLVLWNVEKAPPPDLPKGWDVLHHIGVLYHITNPVEHLNTLLPRTEKAVILDTHVASGPEQATDAYEVDGRSYAYWRYKESHNAFSPFAGMLDHAKWLLVENLMDVLRQNGFQDTRLVEDRMERNGRRVLIWAFR